MTRLYDFVTGIESDTLPGDGSTPTVDADLITKGYADTNYSAGSGVGAYNDTLTIGTGDYTTNDYAIGAADGYRNFLAETSSTNRTITLPAAASSTDRTIIVKKSDSGSGTLTIRGNDHAGAASETLDGRISKILRFQYGILHIVCDGSTWHIIDLYECSGSQSSTVTIDYNNTDPTGATAEWYYVRKGDFFHFHGSQEYSSAGTSNSLATLTLPTNLPGIQLIGMNANGVNSAVQFWSGDSQSAHTTNRPDAYQYSATEFRAYLGGSVAVNIASWNIQGLCNE